MIVRLADGGDAQAIAELRVSPRPTPWEAVAERWGTTQAWPWSRATDGASLLVAIDDGALVGLVGVQPWDDRLAYVAGLVVARHRRNRDIATELLIAALAPDRPTFWRAHNEHHIAEDLSMKVKARIAGTVGSWKVFEYLPQ
jgi:GNAT superfamily N-acetyltransferase